MSRISRTEFLRAASAAAALAGGSALPASLAGEDGRGLGTNDRSRIGLASITT